MSHGDTVSIANGLMTLKNLLHARIRSEFHVELSMQVSATGSDHCMLTVTTSDTEAAIVTGQDFDVMARQVIEKYPEPKQGIHKEEDHVQPKRTATGEGNKIP